MSEPIVIRRRRSPLLACLEALRTLDENMSLRAASALLYVSENDGISVTELAGVMGVNVAGVSRKLAYLAALDPPMVSYVVPDDNRLRLAVLTPDGERVVARLQGLVGQPSAARPARRVEGGKAA